ncbi:MAG: T9SS type A sorting domain-containing protein [Chitinophagales bacterium]
MKTYLTLYLPFFFIIFSFSAHAQIITTFAGTGTPGYNGDGIACTASTLDTPAGVAVDHAHNVYIGDSWNYRIRKVNTSGIITTIAGTGVSGYSGDNGPATLAKINVTTCVFADDSGNVYFADLVNSCIRKINTLGIITTIAGSGTPGFSGDNGPATLAQLYEPDGVYADSLGNIYISDELNNRIRKVNSSGIITTIAGGGTVLGDGGPATAALLNEPGGITMDSSGNLYIADIYNQRVRKVNTSGIITTIAGNGTLCGYNGDGIPATSARLCGPGSVKADRHGNIYIAEGGGQRIRKINTSGIITTIAGNGMQGFSGDNGPAIAAQFDNPASIAIDDSVNMYIADSWNNRIRRIEKVLSVNTINDATTGIKISPNPNTGFFTLTISSVTEQQVELIITNVLGEKIKECKTITNKPLDISISVPTGIYFLSAITASGKITGKMIIQR